MTKRLTETTGQTLMEKEEQEAQARVQEAGQRNVCGFCVTLVIYPKCAIEAVWFVRTSLDAMSWVFFKVAVIVLHDAIIRSFRFF